MGEIPTSNPLHVVDSVSGEIPTSIPLHEVDSAAIFLVNPGYSYSKF
jgi:hypothetical protein